MLDDNRLKQGQTLFGKDYFKELLRRIRSIRASERRIYQQITDIFAECSIDSPAISTFGLARHESQRLAKTKELNFPTSQNLSITV